VSVFGAAHQLLADLGSDLGRSHGADAERPERTQAIALLLRLGYLVEDRSADRLAPASCEESVHRNRLALLNLASRFKAGFELPLPHAPGASFFGAKLSPRDWGLEHLGGESVGVAGKGLTLREAFESCVGEAAAFLSLLEWGDESLVRIAAPGDEDPRIYQPGRPETADVGLTDAELDWCLSGLVVDGVVEPAVLDWIEASDALDDRRALFPAELCLRRRPDLRCGRRPATSSGVGAGATRKQAILDGLLECIERDAIALWWFGGAAARRVDPAVERSHEMQTF
jgi:ribosomal protein S12 methylthiotransferase accessory factor